MTKKHTGRCACGAVKFEFNTDPTFIAVCHCLDCKKASGGEAAAFFGVPEDDFTLISGEPKAFRYVAIRARGWIETLPKLRCQGLHQQPGKLPGNDLRHDRQPG